MKRRDFITLAAGAGVAAALPHGSALAQTKAAIDEIKERGVLRQGHATFVPWAMRDKDGNLIGFELDVAKRLAADMGVKHEAVPTAWDGIIPAMLAGRFDFIISGMTITPARLQTVDFTEPYSFTGAGIVASKKLAPNLAKMEDFNRADFTIAGRRGGSALATAMQLLPKATFRQFDDDAPALQEVLNGKAHAIVTTTPKPKFWSLDNPNELYMPIAGPYADQKDAMALRKGDTKTLAYLNDWIAKRKADGWLKARFTYWFDGRDWLPLVGQQK